MSEMPTPLEKAEVVSKADRKSLSELMDLFRDKTEDQMHVIVRRYFNKRRAGLKADDAFWQTVDET